MRLLDESNEKGAINLRRTEKKVSQNDDVKKNSPTSSTPLKYLHLTLN
jgi:hypothetical protein